MIFVSLGTHPMPFLRVLQELSRLVDSKKITEKIVIQTGYTHFTHPKMDCHDFFSIAEFEKMVEACDIFVTHAGEGNIGLGIQKGKKMIIIPRREKLGEHTNDHQMELADASAKKGYGIVILEISNLLSAIQSIRMEKDSFLEKGYFIPILTKAFREKGILPRELAEEKKQNILFTTPQTASIVVATLNGGEPLVKAINGMLNQDFSGKYEIIVVDDGSFDGKTPLLLRENFEKNNRVNLIFLPRSGVCKARNAGIRAAKYDIVVNMDHDDNPEKDWLRIMMNGFNTPAVGAVSAYGHYGGTSTAFRRDILNHLDGYDEDFFYYREDTDLSFRIIELGFDYVKVNGAKWHGDRTLVTPRGVSKIFSYTVQRFKYHMNDILLHKKHEKSKLCNEFLHVKWKYFVDPLDDFKVATGLWNSNTIPSQITLSSPRGMVFFENKTFLHFFIIVLGGLSYAFAIKWARLAGSIKHRHLLV